LFIGQSGRILPSPSAPVKQLIKLVYYSLSPPANPLTGG